MTHFLIFVCITEASGMDPVTDALVNEGDAIGSSAQPAAESIIYNDEPSLPLPGCFREQVQIVRKGCSGRSINSGDQLARKLYAFIKAVSIRAPKVVCNIQAYMTPCC